MKQQLYPNQRTTISHLEQMEYSRVQVMGMCYESWENDKLGDGYIIERHKNQNHARVLQHYKLRRDGK